MAIKDKSTESNQGKGFEGGAQKPKADEPVNVGGLIQVVQNSAAQQAVTLVKGADKMFGQIEDAAAEAVVNREAQVGVRIMDKVAGRLTQQASTDSLPTDASALQSQLVQVLGEVTRSANWQQCTPDEMARRGDLFLTPGEMMGNAKQLPGA
ncbi:MAG: hypothetical protein AAFV85_23160 [Cyanobacteria bacterium J06634_6]